MEQPQRLGRTSWARIGILAAVAVTAAAVISIVAYVVIGDDSYMGSSPGPITATASGDIIRNKPATNTTGTGDGAVQTYSEYNKADEADCASRGGSYYMASEYYVCQMPVSDEGMRCTDNSQCVGICRAESEEDSEGMCTTFSHGCDIYLDDGQTHWMCS